MGTAQTASEMSFKPLVRLTGQVDSLIGKRLRPLRLEQILPNTVQDGDA